MLYNRKLSDGAGCRLGGQMNSTGSSKTLVFNNSLCWLDVLKQFKASHPQKGNVKKKKGDYLSQQQVDFHRKLVKPH